MYYNYKYILLQTVIVLTTCLMGLSSCENAIDDVNDRPSIEIVSSDIHFGPRGGSGSIGFRSDMAVTAYSERPWCEVSVDGGIVTVLASEYTELENRYSAIVLKTGQDSVKVVAQQNGVIMTSDTQEKYLLNDAKADISFKVEANSDVKVKSSASWLRCSLSEGNVLVDVRKNDSGHVRAGWVEYSCGAIADTVWVSQAEARDLYGNYRLIGYDTSNSLVYLPVTISAGDSDNEFKVSCNASGSLWSFTGMFDPDVHKVHFSNACNVGDILLSGHSFHVFLCMLSKASNSFNWNPQLSCAVDVRYDDKIQSTVLELLPSYYTPENGTEMKMDSWVFAAFQTIDQSTGLPKGNAASYPAILYTPFFQSI